jgi:hypothetical protein
LTKNIIRLAAVLILHSLPPGLSHAAEPVGTPFDEEFSKQEQIYQSRGEQRPEGYVVDRSLLSYTHTLSSAFDSALANLGANDRWLDIGAGRGQAILDYFRPRFGRMHQEAKEQLDVRARAVAISIEDRRTPLWQETAARLGANQIRYLSGKRFREYSSEELGHYKLITDVIGGFSYTSSLSQFTEKVLGILKLNGSFFTVLQDVHADIGTNKPYYDGEPFLTEIVKIDGSELRVCAWLKSITCVEVTCELKPKWTPPIEVYGIRKTCNDVKVPQLDPLHFQAGTPPERRFRVNN